MLVCNLCSSNFLSFILIWFVDCVCICACSQIVQYAYMHKNWLSFQCRFTWMIMLCKSEKIKQKIKRKWNILCTTKLLKVHCALLRIVFAFALTFVCFKSLTVGVIDRASSSLYTHTCIDWPRYAAIYW